MIDLVFMDDEAMAKKVSLTLKLDTKEIDSGEIFLSCSFDGNLENCFLDTGANNTAVIENDFLKKYPSLANRKRQGAFGNIESCHEIIIQHQNLVMSSNEKIFPSYDAHLALEG